MMQGRRHRGETRYQQVQGTRSHPKKPPFHGNWQVNVPAWEKRFCYLVGKVPWSKVIETKRLMYLYDNVVQWNDSACEEAFHNAKGRFWANLNGLPCDTPLPDPNIYIDEIDWDSDVDPELYLDLEREPESPDNKHNHEEVVILDNSVLMSQMFSCHGWGDPKDDVRNPPTPNSGPKNREWDSKGNPWDGSTKKNESSGWNMSRYKTSRYNGEHYQTDRGWWRGGRGRKRVNFVY